MVHQLGIPTILFSMSSADIDWLPLLGCLGLLVDKEVYSDEYITNEMSFDKKCQLVTAHPAVCSRYFNNCVEKYIKLILMSPHSPFGQLVDYVYRFEFQKRGSPHIHGLFWICNAPQYVKNTKAEIYSYINKCISCSLDVLESEKLYVKLQIHKHSKTCKKIVNGKKTCPFGVPWLPMRFTQILEPLEPTECEIYDMLKEQYAKIHDHLQQVPDNIITFNQWLHHISMDDKTYINAICTSIVHPKIFLKRNPTEICVNTCMKALLGIWQAYHDVQFVLDAYQCVCYIWDYMTKSQKGMSELLEIACEEASAGNMNLKHSVCHMGNKLLNAAENPVQECCYDIFQLPIKNSTHRKEFITTCLPEQCVASPKALMNCSY